MSASDLRVVLIACAVAALAACGHQDAREPARDGDAGVPLGTEPDASAQPEGAPAWLLEGGEVDTRHLLHWLQASRYSGWASTGWPRPTPEGSSTVFLNASLERSIAEGARVHPVGAIAVRELYDLDLTSPRAINVLVKVSPEAGAGSWRWIERSSPDALSLDALGAPECVGCHTGPEDVILTDSPLR